MEDAEFIENLGESKEKVTGFLQKICGPDQEQDFKLIVSQSSKNGEMQLDIIEYNLGDDIDSLADEIIETAETEAREQRFRGTVRYSLKTLGLPKPKRLVFSLKCVLSKGDDDDVLSEADIDDYDDELPNARGLTGQAMKHAEATTKLMISVTKDGLNRQAKEIADLKRELREERSRAMANLRLYEELQSMQFARGMEIKKFDADEERKDKMLEVATSLAPPILNRLMGGGAAAAVASEGVRTPIEQMVSSLMGSIEPEQYAALASVLTKPEQIMILMELKNYVDSRNAADAQIKAQQAAAQAAQQPQPQEQIYEPPPPPPYAQRPANPHVVFTNHPFAVTPVTPNPAR